MKGNFLENVTFGAMITLIIVVFIDAIITYNMDDDESMILGVPQTGVIIDIEKSIDKENGDEIDVIIDLHNGSKLLDFEVYRDTNSSMYNYLDNLKTGDTVTLFQNNLTVDEDID